MKKNNRNIIGVRLKNARLSEKPKATQKDISARLEIEGINLSDSTIGKIENGTSAVTDIQLMAFAKVLKVSPVWLLTGKE